MTEKTAAGEQDVTFGQVVSQAFDYTSKLIRESIELLRDSDFKGIDGLDRKD